MTVASVALALCAFVYPCASTGLSGTRTPVALTAAPARVVLTGTTRMPVRVTNSGSKRVVVDVSRAGYALTLRGRPRIVRTRRSRSAAAWLSLRPRRLALPAHTSASLLLSATVPRKAEPGDHDALVLLTTQPSGAARVAVRARLGVVVVVQVPGKIIRRLRLRGLRVDRRGGHRLLELRVANRGNVTETLSRIRVSVVRARTGRRLATLVASMREVRPHTQAIVEFRYRRALRGAVSARVVIPAVSGRSAVRRTYSIRL
ncbi:MAG TPA: hypothetical protein VKD88_04100 [Gaiellaceae bacterium]|nr:hypothetical protein [Gaiellaceae bacterium]